MHYLDHAATTTVRPEAAEAYREELRHTGNASSVHAAGRRARRRLEEARERIAALLGADPAGVILTSGGTEADAVAVIGGGRARRRTLGRDVVVVSAIEHPAVLGAAAALEAEGFVRRTLPVDSTGIVLADSLPAIDETTALVSVMWANNETGVLQPVADVVERARRCGALVHTDAVQAVGHVPVDVDGAGVDLLSLSGHKVGAPAGIGALLVRRGVTLDSLVRDGSHERSGGTANVAGAVALATALEIAVTSMASEMVRLRALRDELIRALVGVGGVHVSGAGLPEELRLPTIAHAVLEGVRADPLLFALDRAGIAASAGSACRAGVQEPSHVVLAMGFAAEHGRSGLRCSLGWDSTSEDVAAFVGVIGDAVRRARNAG